MKDNAAADTPSNVPQYSIGEVAETTGISAFTLRYYDKCKFFPGLYRDKNNVRKFSDADIAWLELIDALRKSGLSIEGIRYFVRLTVRGKMSLEQRHAILQAQETTLEYQLAEVEKSLTILKRQREELSKQLSEASGPVES